MREYKFRGKTPNGAWAYGSFWNHPVYPDIIEDYSTHRLVDSDTVGQFTGLKDSEGREIYEGDIVRTDDWSTPSYIRWDVATASFVVDRWSVNLAHVSQIKVIGNVYDNPELLNEVRS